VRKNKRQSGGLRDINILCLLSAFVGTVLLVEFIASHDPRCLLFGWAMMFINIKAQIQEQT